MELEQPLDNQVIQDAPDLGVDLSTATETGDPLNSVIAGPGPGSKNSTSALTKPTGDSYKDAIQQYKMTKAKVLDFANRGVVDIQQSAYNKAGNARTFDFDPVATNMDRYLGYGKSTFNKVGFSPFIDNETKFNEKTNTFQDLTRAAIPFAGLLWEGGISGYRSMGSIFSDDGGFFSPDDKTAEMFKKYMDVGMSSRGNMASSINNFLLNSAYTVGIFADIALEEIGLAAATALTEGGAAPELAARSMFNFKRAGDAVRGAMKTNSVSQMFKGGVELASSLGKVGEAKTFWSTARAGATTFGKGAFNFVNPLTRTTQDVVDIAKGTSSMKNLSNLAKLQNTFGSFYRDIRDGNLALAESKLEGGSAKQEEIERLINKYENEHGERPTGKALDRIYQQGEDVGNTVTQINFPVIFLSNRFVLDGLFKFRGVTAAADIAEQEAKLASKGISFNVESGFTESVKEGWMKSSWNAITTPRTYLNTLGNIGRYTTGNFMEGFQESAQNVISDATKGYYDKVYKDPTLGSTDLIKGLAWDSIKKQATTREGLETFASGFLMGGLMGGAGNIITKGIPNLYTRFAKPEQYKEYQVQKATALKDAVNALNELYKNPTKYFSADRESTAVQKESTDIMNQADSNGDSKTFQDAKDQKDLDHVYKALQNGTFDSLLQSYQELRKMNKEDLGNFLNIDNHEKALERLDGIIEKAKYVKNKYEVINEKFQNPFNPKGFKEGSEGFVKEAIAYTAFEKAKKSAVLADYGFERALDRMNSLHQDLSQAGPVSKISGSDINLLLDREGIAQEITNLKKEIAAYDKGDAEQKKMAAKKQERLDALREYRNALDEHTKAQKSSNRQDGEQLTMQFPEESTKLKDAYKSWLKHLAKVNNQYIFNDKVDDSFVKILDFYSLHADAQNYNKVLNHLLDPTNLYNHAKTINERFQELWDNRDEDIFTSISKAYRMAEYNELLKTLTAQGIKLDGEELIEFIKNGVKPKTFYDATTGEELAFDSDKHAKARELFAIDDQIRETPKPEAEPATEAPKASTTTTPVQTAPVKEEEEETNLPEDLKAQLQTAYDEYIKNNPDANVSFNQFISSSTQAARITQDYFNKPTTKPAAESTTTAPSSDIEKRRQEAIDQATTQNSHWSTPLITTDEYNNEFDNTPTKVTWWNKQDMIDDINSGKYDTQLTGSQSTQTTQSEPVEREVVTKARNLLASITSVKELPDLTGNRRVDVDIDIQELIGEGLTSDEVISLVNARKKELLQNLRPSDLQINDILIFVDGQKGWVKSVTGNQIKVKMAGSKKGVNDVINIADLRKRITMIENGKKISLEPTPDIEVQPEDLQHVEESKDSMTDFRANAADVRQAGENAAKQAGTDNQTNIDNLLNNLGCKTK